MSSYPIVVS
jgi:hypothetical protein